MQLRCTYCQKMFAMSRDEMLFALQNMADEKQNHANAHCPHCRRANRVERRKLELANPNWRASIQEMAKENTAKGKDE